MSNSFLKAASLTLCLAITPLAFVGCNGGAGSTRRNQPGGISNENVQQNDTPDGNPNRFLNMDLGSTDDNNIDSDNIVGQNSPSPENSSPASPSNGQGFDEMKQKSDNISNELETMPDIEQANVLIAGNTCLVGYSPSNTQGDPNARKNMVMEKVKQIDPSINNVIASESQDVIDRIGQLVNDITNNKPMDEVNNEIMQLMKTAAPSIS
ncbi:MAG: sporulation protein [Clostridium sp.]|nr:sporulation protein [Clostridium sp.]